MEALQMIEQALVVTARCVVLVFHFPRRVIPVIPTTTSAEKQVMLPGFVFIFVCCSDVARVPKVIMPVPKSY
jgi:hypothetical protein